MKRSLFVALPLALLTALAYQTHTSPVEQTSPSYTQRAAQCSNGVARTLLLLMDQKKTNLAAAADMTTTQEILAFADLVGPHICMLKIHVDIIDDFSPAFITDLQALAHKHAFLLCEDRKFADIGNTAQQQYTNGIYHIADWADLVTVHAVSGPGMLGHMKAAVDTTKRAAIMLAQMSTIETLARGNYTIRAIDNGYKHSDFVMGFISRSLLDVAPSFVLFTPGVHLTGGVASDQEYITPYEAICECDSDVIIVGRALYSADNPLDMTLAYRTAAWDAYQQRIGQKAAE